VTIDFEEARRRLEDDPTRVRCAHCGRWIVATEDRCAKCGTRFAGAAMQFTHEATDDLRLARDLRRKRMRAGVFTSVGIVIAATVLYLSASFGRARASANQQGDHRENDRGR
jgi:hypothetical protein